MSLIRRAGIVLLVCLLLTTIVSAAAPRIVIQDNGVMRSATTGGFRSELRSLNLGENITLNATVINRLQIEDRLRIRIHGPAIQNNRIVKPFFPTSVCPTVTTTDAAVCEMVVPAETSRNLTLILHGTGTGQAQMVANVNSTTTNLGSQDSIRIRVFPNYPDSGVLAAPGIQLPHILAIAVMGSVLLLISRRRENRHNL